MKSKISIIASMGPNRELGYQGKLCYDYKPDMRLFKETTLNHAVIMGRKTAESLPKPLTHRLNLVLSNDEHWCREGFYRFFTIQDALNYLITYNKYNWFKTDEVFVIGGAEIYRAFLDANLVDLIYLTRYSVPTEADTYFPVLGTTQWSLVNTTVINSSRKDIGKVRFTVFKHRVLNMI